MLLSWNFLQFLYQVERNRSADLFQTKKITIKLFNLYRENYQETRKPRKGKWGNGLFPMKWIRGQGGEGPRARSASGLITHASWWIINISSSRRLVGRAKWNERERERDVTAVRRHGRTRLAFSSALYTDPFAIVNRTRIDGRVIDRWLAFPRNLAPTLAEACLVQRLGATTFEYRFPYLRRSDQGRIVSLVRI